MVRSETVVGRRNYSVITLIPNFAIRVQPGWHAAADGVCLMDTCAHMESERAVLRVLCEWSELQRLGPIATRQSCTSTGRSLRCTWNATPFAQQELSTSVARNATREAHRPLPPLAGCYKYALSDLATRSRTLQGRSVYPAAVLQGRSCSLNRHARWDGPASRHRSDAPRVHALC